MECVGWASESPSTGISVVDGYCAFAVGSGDARAGEVEVHGAICRCPAVAFRTSFFNAREANGEHRFRRGEVEDVSPNPGSLSCDNLKRASDVGRAVEVQGGDDFVGDHCKHGMSSWRTVPKEN